MLTVGQLLNLLSKCNPDAFVDVEIYIPETEYISLDNRIEIDDEGDFTLFSSDIHG